MRKTKRGPKRGTDPRAHLLRSIHFLRPVPGPKGDIRVLYEDEANWSVQVMTCEVGGGEASGSQFDIKRTEAQPAQIFPVPHWLINYRPTEEDLVILNVPIHNAVVRAPMKLVGEGDKVRAIPARIWDEQRRAAEAPPSDEPEGDPEPEGDESAPPVSDLSGLVAPGPGTTQ